MNGITNTETRLVNACLNGNRKAQSTLYQKYEVKMFGLCLRYAKTREEAEDILQEGFFKVFTSLHQYSGKGSLEGWIRKVMVNTSLMFIRKRKAIHFPDLPIDLLADRQTTTEDIFSTFGANAIIKMIQQLPGGYQAVFNLYAIEGYSHKEVGEQLNITESTSRSQYTRARNLLKQMLEKHLTS